VHHYETLTEDDLFDLATERVKELETQHFRHRLRLADAQSPREEAQLRRALADLEARIEVHSPPAPPSLPEEPVQRTGPVLDEAALAKLVEQEREQDGELRAFSEAESADLHAASVDPDNLTPGDPGDLAAQAEASQDREDTDTAPSFPPPSDDVAGPFGGQPYGDGEPCDEHPDERGAPAQ
jgi:hypothetical protein